MPTLSRRAFLLLAAILALLAMHAPTVAAQGNNNGGGGGGGGNANNGGGGNANNGGGGNANNGGGGNANNGGGGNANNGGGDSNNGGNGGGNNGDNGGNGGGNNNNNGGGNNSNNGGDLVGEGPGVISGGDARPDARPRFIWPPEQQPQPWWQVPVVAKGSKTHPLNISWTLEGLQSKPSRIVLQYYKDSAKSALTNITTLPASETKFNWELPAAGGIEMGRDYKLKISSTEPPQEGEIPWTGIFSGRFQVYTPSNLTAVAAQRLDPASSAMAGLGGSSGWMAVVGAGAFGLVLAL